MTLASEILNEIKDYALRNKDIEVCGFVVKNNEKIIFKPIANSHPSKETFFLVSPKEYLEIKSKYQILYLFHSHPIGFDFSKIDLKYQKYHNINMLLYNVAADLFQEKCVNID
jgi:proteasome lid subunit RPN8/RPN11